MGEFTKISWTDATFSPWAGCTKVSPACKFCYAEADTKRRGFVIWGPEAERRVTSDAYWKQPLKWNDKAYNAGVRKRVFCGSWCDVMEDRPGLDEYRMRLYELIAITPCLDWQLLTKRPENYVRFLPETWLENPRKNVWLGTTAEDQEWADKRIGYLRSTPAFLRFVSLEPLLGPITFRWAAWDAGSPHPRRVRQLPDVQRDGRTFAGSIDHLDGLRMLDWVIVGGESGPHARPMEPAWARTIRDQCVAAGVPFLFKQWGENNADLVRIGRKASGHLLDGVEWQQVPVICGQEASK